MGRYSDTSRGHAFAGLANLFEGVMAMKRAHKEQEERERLQMQEAAMYKQKFDTMEKVLGPDVKDFAQLNTGWMEPGGWTQFYEDYKVWEGDKRIEREAQAKAKIDVTQISAYTGVGPQRPAAEPITEGALGFDPFDPNLNEYMRLDEEAPSGPRQLHETMTDIYQMEERERRAKVLGASDVENDVWDQRRLVEFGYINGDYAGRESQYHAELKVLDDEIERRHKMKVELARDKKAVTAVEKEQRDKTTHEKYKLADEFVMRFGGGEVLSEKQKQLRIQHNAFAGLDNQLPLEGPLQMWRKLRGLYRDTNISNEIKRGYTINKVLTADVGEIYQNPSGFTVAQGLFITPDTMMSFESAFAGEKGVLYDITHDDDGLEIKGEKEAKAIFKVFLEDAKKNSPEEYRRFKTEKKNYFPFTEDDFFNMTPYEAIMFSLDYEFNYGRYYTRDIKVEQPGM